MTAHRPVRYVSDTPPERVARYRQTPTRQCPTAPVPGRNDLFHPEVPDEFIDDVLAVGDATNPTAHLPAAY